MIDIKKVKVFHKDIKINYLSNLMANRGKLGECGYLLDEIDISSEATDNSQISVLLHEILHASIEMLDPDLNEEKNIKLLEIIFATLLRDNIEVFRTILNILENETETR